MPRHKFTKKQRAAGGKARSKAKLASAKKNLALATQAAAKARRKHRRIIELAKTWMREKDPLASERLRKELLKLYAKRGENGEVKTLNQ